LLDFEAQFAMLVQDDWGQIPLYTVYPVAHDVHWHADEHAKQLLIVVEHTVQVVPPSVMV